MRTVFETGMTRDARGARQGSALITSVILVFVIAMLAGSFLYLAGSEYRLASRTFLSGACFDLAEGGVDLAIDALNDDDTDGWTVSGSTWTRELTSGMPVSSANNGELRVVILNAGTSSPTIYSEGLVSGHLAGDLAKQLKVTVETGTTLGDSGFVADLITNNGNKIEIKQYDSRLGAPGETLDDGSENWSDDIRVSTSSLINGAIDVGNADIYGFIATGGGVPDVGPNGGVYSFDNPGVHDETRITYDYYANFEAPSTPNILSDYADPPSISSGDNLVPGGVYYLDGSGDSISTTNGKNIVIGDDADGNPSTVIMILKNGASLSLKGDVTIEDGSRLLVFTEGDVAISGDINNNNPDYDATYTYTNPLQLGEAGAETVTGISPAERFTIYGTNPTDGAQTIKLNGAGELTAFVYAPTANIEIKGGGGSDVGYFNGAVVGYSAVVTGNMQFRYDRAIGDADIAGGGYTVIQWYELNNETAETQRVDMATWIP